MDIVQLDISYKLDYDGLSDMLLGIEIKNQK